MCVLATLAFAWQHVHPDSGFGPHVLSLRVHWLAFYAVGAFEGKSVQQVWYSSGLKTLLAGGSAAALTYVAGTLLGGLA